MRSRKDQILGVLDRISEWTGRFGALLIVFMMLTVVYEVVVRYVFNSPTIWSFAINQFLLVWASALGGGYALLHGSHVKADVLYSRLQIRKKAMIDIATSSLFFLFVGVMLWQTSKAALWSIKINEHSPTVFAPPLYPIKIILPIGFLIILLQGLAKFVRDLTTAITGIDNSSKLGKGMFGA
jgi:TRAP-type mannitol/chloroaromatic compound transport system permease small subunit